MAYGLPVEGADGPFLGDDLVSATTCDIGATVGEARRLLGDEPVIVLADGLAVGEVDGTILDDHADDVRVLDVMDPVPTTVRPSVTEAAAAEGGGGRQLVTTPDGRLVGQAVVAGHEHEHIDEEAFDRELASVLAAVEERFGDREPSEEELRTFLRERLVADGRSPEDADSFLDELESGDS